MSRPTIERQLRDRLTIALSAHQKLFQDRQVSDRLLEVSVDRLEEYLVHLSTEIEHQRNLIQKAQAQRELEADEMEAEIRNVILAKNFSDVFFVSDVHLMAQHLLLVDDIVLLEALTALDPEVVEKLTRILETLREATEGTV